LRPSSPLTSIGFAALLGAGLGAGTLAMLPRGGPSADDVAQAESTMKAAAAQGFVDGRWRIVEPMWTRERVFARDPAHADLCQIRLLDRPGAKPLAAVCRDLTRHLLGDVDQFLEAYRVTTGPVVEGSGASRSVSYEWTKEGGDTGPTRRAWFDASTGSLVRFVERDGRGAVLRSVELVQSGLGDWQPTPMSTSQAARVAVGRATVPDFAAFVASVSLPTYEPATLPPRFHRSDYGFDASRMRSDPTGEPLPILWVTYTDGVVRMNLFVTRKADMRRLDALARQQDTVAGRSLCASSGAETPEELLEGADAILVHRRDDGCRVVLQRDDLPDVAVALVGYRGLAPEDYVRTIRSLVRVAPARPGEVPLHEDPPRDR
jgi:hypothetical protein